MIKCLCINAKNKPDSIPLEKWLKENEVYSITYVQRCKPPKNLGYSLYELPLIDCGIFEYFSSDRFLIHEDSIDDFADLLNICLGPIDNNIE